MNQRERLKNHLDAILQSLPDELAKDCTKIEPLRALAQKLSSHEDPILLESCLLEIDALLDELSQDSQKTLKKLLEK